MDALQNKLRQLGNRYDIRPTNEDLYLAVLDLWDKVHQDKNETLVWECTDTQLIKFAHFLIAGGQKQ